MAAVVQRVKPGQIGPDVVSLSVQTSSGEPTAMNPRYTLTPWWAEMTMTVDTAETTHYQDGYRSYIQLPTGRAYVVAVGDIRDVKRVTDGA